MYIAKQYLHCFICALFFDLLLEHLRLADDRLDLLLDLRIGTFFLDLLLEHLRIGIPYMYYGCIGSLTVYVLEIQILCCFYVWLIRR